LARRVNILRHGCEVRDVERKDEEVEERHGEVEGIKI
jgi:hypothetical protein